MHRRRLGRKEKKRKENIRSEKWQSHYDMTVMFFCGEKLICNLIFT